MNQFATFVGYYSKQILSPYKSPSVVMLPAATTSLAKVPYSNASKAQSDLTAKK